VPGVLGNQLEGKLNKTTAPHMWCEKHSDDYVTLWLSVTDLLPGGAVECLSDNLRSVSARGSLFCAQADAHKRNEKCLTAGSVPRTTLSQ